MKATPRAIAQMGAALALAAQAVVYRFPPGAYGFYPACPIATWLHVECPGCGSTRALYALLHLNLAESVAWNPLLPGLFFVVMTWAAAQYLVATWRGRFFRWAPTQLTYWAAATAAMAFCVVRNLA